MTAVQHVVVELAERLLQKTSHVEARQHRFLNWEIVACEAMRGPIAGSPQPCAGRAGADLEMNSTPATHDGSMPVHAVGGERTGAAPRPGRRSCAIARPRTRIA